MDQKRKKEIFETLRKQLGEIESRMLSEDGGIQDILLVISSDDKTAMSLIGHPLAQARDIGRLIDTVSSALSDDVGSKELALTIVELGIATGLAEAENEKPKEEVNSDGPGAVRMKLVAMLHGYLERLQRALETKPEDRAIAAAVAEIANNNVPISEETNESLLGKIKIAQCALGESE